MLIIRLWWGYVHSLRMLCVSGDGNNQVPNTDRSNQKCPLGDKYPTKYVFSTIVITLNSWLEMKKTFSFNGKVQYGYDMESCHAHPVITQTISFS